MFSFTDQEQANYVSQNNYPPKNNPYSNTYNAGGRNYPNFSWSNNQNVQNPQRQQEISGKGITIKLHHKQSNQIQSQRRMTLKVLYSNL
jgi:hypothetical protein